MPTIRRAHHSIDQLVRLPDTSMPVAGLRVDTPRIRPAGVAQEIT